MKKVISILMTIALLVVIYSRLSISQVVIHFKGANLIYVTVAFVLLFAIYLIRALRWQFILGKSNQIRYNQLFQMTLAASTLNMLLPSKIGDFSKAYFCHHQKCKINNSRVVSSIVLERVFDIVGLILVMLSGILFIENTSSWVDSTLILAIVFLGMFLLLLLISPNNKMIHLLSRWPKIQDLIKNMFILLSEIKKDKPLLIKVFLSSIALWGIVLMQTYCFFLMFNSFVSLALIFGLVPMALFAGMFPFSVSGIGVRDAALIVLFSSYVSAEIVAGVGLCLSLRHVIAALLGLPLFLKYFRDNVHQQ
ncbi:MAG: flippase-like domain-containing protein [Candidatus Omnitrophica bacterium]|nr:flippase-like domain-containing protein [Candidatus Omnitrophota bacterium]